MDKIRVCIYGGGDLASGIAHRLFITGFSVAVTELKQPRMVRRTVSFGSAVYEKEVTVEGVRAFLSDGQISHSDAIAVFVDDNSDIRSVLKPDIIVDARMLKRKTDILMSDACLVIGIGPGFDAGADVHMVVETQRGIDLGRVYRTGCAIADTGIPGIVEGKGTERVLRAVNDGFFHPQASIGDIVEEGQVLAEIGGKKVPATFTGKLRGLIYEGLYVREGEKIGDIDPRTDVDCNKISDKARAIGGGVLEAIFSFFKWNISI